MYTWIRITIPVDSPLSLEAALEVARLGRSLDSESGSDTGSTPAEPCTVGDLSAAVEMEQPAVSHQLRVLRDLGLVIGNRNGRHTVYGLFDTHVAHLLDEALRHIDHVATNSATSS